MRCRGSRARRSERRRRRAGWESSSRAATWRRSTGFRPRPKPATPCSARRSPADALGSDRAPFAESSAEAVALGGLLEGVARAAHGPMAAVAMLRAAALYEDAGEPGRAAALYRERLEANGESDAHAALG